VRLRAVIRPVKHKSHHYYAPAVDRTPGKVHVCPAIRCGESRNMYPLWKRDLRRTNDDAYLDIRYSRNGADVLARGEVGGEISKQVHCLWVKLSRHVV
jgi:hypothetical protein